MKKIRGDEILESMRLTYQERNKIYGDNFETVGKVLAVLFPEGLTLKTAEEFEAYHLLDWIVGKLTRFTATQMQHQDSIHDIAVYSAMLEANIQNRRNIK